MKREDVVEELTAYLAQLVDDEEVIAAGAPCFEDAAEVQAFRDVLRAAIALLAPPKQEEIEAARATAEILLANGFSSCDPEKAETLIKATYALAREPGLEAKIALREIDIGHLRKQLDSGRRSAHIAALEAQLARVRAVRDDWKNRVGTASRGEVLLDSGYNEAWAHCLEALDAALAVPTTEG